MKEYFQLQFQMNNRKLQDMGIQPVPGYVLILALGIALSEFLFFKTEFASYAIVLAVLSFLLRLSEAKRRDFLTLTFGDSHSLRIRIFENMALCLPVSVLLLFHRAWIESMLLPLVGFALAKWSFKTNQTKTLPTPFSKKPFEFFVGFRNTFFLIPFTWLLTFTAVYVDNINLAIFALLLVFLITYSYYLRPEEEYYVWNYATTPSRFLFGKLWSGTYHALILVLPVLMILIVFYPASTPSILMFLLTGMAFLWTIVLAKYAAYPNEINVPEGILLAISISFPPFLLALLPYFFRKSILKLNPLLK